MPDCSEYIPPVHKPNTPAMCPERSSNSQKQTSEPRPSARRAEIWNPARQGIQPAFDRKRAPLKTATTRTGKLFESVSTFSVHPLSDSNGLAIDLQHSSPEVDTDRERSLNKKPG